MNFAAKAICMKVNLKKLKEMIILKITVKNYDK